MNLPPSPYTLPDKHLSYAITGHQDLGLSRSWVADFLFDVVQLHAPLRALSSLARGADQIFADAVIRTDQRLVVVVPCEGYERTFGTAEDRAEYARLLSAAADRILLPFSNPSEQAFWAAGRRLVDEADVVVAVWDGEPARGLGGTADVVAYAKRSSRRVLHAHPINRTVTWI